MRARTLQSPGPGHPALAPEGSCALQSQKEGKGASLAQVTRRGLCSPCREKVYSHQELGDVTEKTSGAALGEDSVCSTGKRPASGQAWFLQAQESLPRGMEEHGVGKGQGPEGAVGVRTLPVSWCWDPNPEEDAEHRTCPGSYYCAMNIISTASRLYGALSAQDFSRCCRRV